MTISTDNVSSADNHAGKTLKDCFDKRKFAYLLGVYLGDGCASTFTNHHVFSLESEDSDVVKSIRKIVNGALKKKYPLTYLKPNKIKLYRFRAWNKDLFDLLRSETENKTKLPEYIVSEIKSISSEFVSGLMDTDGYISCGINKFGQQRFSLGFTNSGKWLDQFITCLENLGVKVGKKTLKKKYRSEEEKDCYQVNINLRSYVEASLYFNCQRKQRILEGYISSVRYQSY